MRIAYIHHNLARESGDPRMAAQIMQHLNKAGHEIAGYTFLYDSHCFNDLMVGIDVRVVASSTGRIGGKLDKLYATLERGVDVLVCHNDFSYRLGIRYKKANPRTKIVWIMNNAPFVIYPKPNILLYIAARIKAFFSKLTVKRFIRGVDLIVVHDQGNKEYAQQLHRPIAVIPIGVEFDKFYNPVREISVGQKILLLGVGAFSAYRRFEDIISAVAELRKRGLDVRATLVCKDFGTHPRYRVQFERYIQQSGVQKYIDARFYGATDMELLELYRKSSIFIFPNHIRIWGMAAFEAMAAGLPLVVSRITSAAEVLREGEHALFVDPLHPEQIADCVEKFVQNPVLHKRMAVAGQEFVRTQLSWKRYVEDFEKAVKSLAGKAA